MSDDQVRAMLVDTTTRLFAGETDAKVLEEARRDGFSPSLWEVIESAELPRIATPESAGGAGGSLSDLAEVLRIAGRHVAPVPLAETALLGNWMLAGCGLPVEQGALAVAPTGMLRAERRGERLVVSGELVRVPWARTAARLIAFAELDGKRQVVALGRHDYPVQAGRNLAGEPRDCVRLERAAVRAWAPAADHVTSSALRLRGALGRALLIAGALERALELAVEYARNRVQFGRRIGEFQSIQHELARAAGEVAAAVAAALSAAGALERGEDMLLAVASARVRTAEAAREVALIAHQVHGAIGVTDEYALHHATLRLWSWREEYGTESEWAIELGRALQRSGAQAAWPTLSGTAPFTPEHAGSL
jgi:acyl-CoA dehydrogenase